MSQAFFYAIEPRAWSRDRTYRVYVCREMLAGAYVAGQIRDEQSFWRMFGQHAWLSPFFYQIMYRKLAQRDEREARYDGSDPFLPELLDADGRNFQVPRRELQRMRFQRKATRRSPLDVGVIEIQTADGKTRRLIPIGGRDPDSIIGFLRTFEPTLEVTGKSRFLSHADRQKPSHVRRNALIGGLTLISFSATAAITYLTGWTDNIEALIFGLLGLFTGAGSLFQAWRIRDAADPDDELQA